MLRRTICSGTPLIKVLTRPSCPRSNRVLTRSCHHHEKHNAEDLLRANNIIQYTKDDIIQEIRTTVNKEFEIKIRQETAMLHGICMIQSVSIFFISIGIMIR